MSIEKGEKIKDTAPTLFAIYFSLYWRLPLSAFYVLFFLHITVIISGVVLKITKYLV